jgi:hypothetical protein
LAQFKAAFINSIVKDKNIHSVIEFGCGDGNQLSLALYTTYIGLDVAAKAIKLCQQRFAHDSSKRFLLYDCQTGLNEPLYCDLSLSLDVIYHLIEDDVFDLYMTRLFQYARSHVIIYSSNSEQPSPDPHVRHRRFSSWVANKQPACIREDFQTRVLPFGVPGISANQHLGRTPAQPARAVKEDQRHRPPVTGAVKLIHDHLLRLDLMSHASVRESARARDVGVFRCGVGGSPNRLRTSTHLLTSVINRIHQVRVMFGPPSRTRN